MKKIKSSNLLIVVVSLIFSFILAEIGYRIILFGDNPAFAHLRKPELYAKYLSEDDYWKLQYLFGGEFKPPAKPHPELGWVGPFSREDYTHHQLDQVGVRKPVLLYGDSYAACVSGVSCFQKLLNNDEMFSEEHFLLNYGVGGYGVDQIFLLFQKSFELYDDPFIVISLMTLDLDRSILSVRTGQKPVFVINNDELEIGNAPIDSDPENFFVTHPPRIKSYLYRRIIHGDFLPERSAAFLRRDSYYLNMKKQVNEKIILEITKKLRAKKIDFVFVIFHPNAIGTSSLEGENEWRDIYLKEILHNNDIPYIWSKDIYRKDNEDNKRPFDDYIFSDNGHPTTYFNHLIADEIKKHVLENK